MCGVLFLSFFCSCSETSLFSLSSFRIEALKKKHPKRGRLIELLINNPQKLIITILIFNTLANILATLVASRILAKLIPNLNPILEVLLITLTILLFGEVTPKAIATKIASSFSLLVAPAWIVIQFLFNPIIWGLKNIAKLLVAINSFIFFHGIKEEQKDYETEEMIDVIKDSHHKGIINKEEELILGNVIELSDTEVWEIMRHRNNIFSVSIKTPIEKLMEMIKAKKYTKIPVWEGEEENIIGILYVSDIINLTSSKRKLSYYKYLLKPPFYIPASSKVENVLKMFQMTAHQIVLVIDEFGGISGLVTQKDIFRAIIGHIKYKDRSTLLYKEHNPYTIEIEANIDIYEFNKIFKTNIKSENNASVGGYILEHINRIPENGEILTIENLNFQILSAKPNVIEKVLVTKKNREENSKEETNSGKSN